MKSKIAAVREFISDWMPRRQQPRWVGWQPQTWAQTWDSCVIAFDWWRMCQGARLRAIGRRLGWLPPLLLLMTMAVMAACATSGGAISRPVTPVAPPAPVAAPAPTQAPSAAPVVVHTHPIANIGAWLDASQDTAAFTTFITVQPGCGDDAQFATAQLELQRDTRKIVWFINVFAYGPTARSRGGYSLRSDASACWQELKALIANYPDRTIGVWFLDEPDSVAWNDRAETDPYDPNLYNDIIGTACAMVHADFPALAVGLNYGGVEPGLTPPACLNIVGLESYGADWQANLLTLEPLTSAELWLLSPAYTDAGNATDQEIATRLQDEFDYAQTDPRVSTVDVFLWCCDDTETGDMQFYSASGPMLPSTRAAFIAIGTAVRGAQ